jgi:hypothetical protein
MLKKVVGRAVAGTAAAGLVMVPAVTTVAPQLSNVSCQYNDTVTTSTDLTLRYVVAPYGARNVATATVSAGADDPAGKVRITVAGVGSWTRTLGDGNRVSQALPRALDAGKTYTVRARFLGKCRFRDSSDGAAYTVQRAQVNVNPAVGAKRKAQFSASFVGSGGLDPRGGKARFVVKRLGNGEVVRARDAWVRNGFAAVDLANLGKGSYRLVVKYSGTSNFARSADTVDFRIGRR